MYDGLEEVDLWVRFVLHPRKSIIEAGLLTNLGGFAGANSSHKLDIGLRPLSESSSTPSPSLRSISSQE